MRGLGVYPALDRVPAQLDVVLGDRELLARRDPHLLADDVDPGDHLGHAVLDLDPGVHLEEEVVVADLHPLDRSGASGNRPPAPPRWRSCRSARASRRRRAARAPPRSASGGGAESSSRARRGGSRCPARRRAPGPRRDGGPRGSARGRRGRRRRTSRPRARRPRTPRRARRATGRRESPCRRRPRRPCSDRVTDLLRGLRGGLDVLARARWSPGRSARPASCMISRARVFEPIASIAARAGR